MDKILISACLLGEKTKYDGNDNYFPFVERLAKSYDLVPFCPEVEAGLPIPREPAEIVRNEVLSKSGLNLTKKYNQSAEKALNICRYLGIKIAILKDGSPACGPRTIHDGSFTDTKIEGLGVTARYLIAHGIKVYSEKDKLDFLLEDEKEKARLKRQNVMKDAVKKKRIAESKKKRKETEEATLFVGDESKGKRFDRKPARKFNDRKPFKKSYGKPFERKDGEEGYKKRTNSRPYGKPRFDKDRKPFDKANRPTDGKPEFKKSFKKPYRKDNDKPSYEKKGFKKDGNRSFNRNGKPSFKKPGFKKSSFTRKPNFSKKKD